MAFIFNSANNNIISGSLDLFNGIFNLYIVSNTPLQTNNTVASLSLFSNTTPLVLTNNFTSNSWNFIDTTVSLYTYSTAPFGFVISKQVSINPSSTDPIIYYSEFTNSLGQIINYNTGLYRILINFVATGLISFSNTYEYFSGAYVNNEPVPKGLLYLLGSNNNTASYANPQPNKILSTSSSSSITGRSQTTDRNILTDNQTFDANIAYDFGTRSIRVGVLGIRYNSSASPGTLWGTNSNSISFTPIGISDNIGWNQIGTIPASAAGIWGFTTSNSSNYWRYVKLSGNFNIFDLEFYNSSILSTTLNLT